MSRNRFAKDIFLGLLVSAAVLLFLEFAARLVASVRDDVTAALQRNPPDTSYASYSPKLGWINRPGFRGETAKTLREFDSDGHFAIDTSEVADTNSRKILFIGDSNTFGFGVEADSTFAEITERLLPGMAAINLGVPGYTSYQGRVVLDEYLPTLRPELIVVSFNFNDRRYADSGVPDSAERFQALFEQMQHASRDYTEPFEHLYLFKAIRSVMRRVHLLEEPPSEYASLDTLRPRVDERAYRDNLTYIAQVVKRAGVPLIFVVLMDNPIQTHHIRQADLLASVDRATAINHLLVAANSPQFGALARLALAQIYETAGEEQTKIDQILRYRLVRSLHGGVVVRSDVQYSDIMRAVAIEEGVVLVDATPVLSDHPGFFVDECHFDAQGHRLVGELLASRISTLLSATRRDDDEALERPIDR